MPGYGGQMDTYTPTPTDEVQVIEQRFTMPTLTLVQLVLVGFIVMYAWKARKMKGVVVGSIAFAIGLLHIYDHLYRVKRGPEHLFFLPRGEGYKALKGLRMPRRKVVTDTAAMDAITKAQDDINQQMKVAMKPFR